MLGMSMTSEEIDRENLKMLKKSGYPNNKQTLYRMNPELFAKYKYLVNVEPERMFPRNEEYMQAIYSQLYAQLRADPLIEGEELLRKVLYAFFRGDGEDLIKKQQPQELEQMTRMLGGKPSETVMGKQAQNKTSANALAGVGLAQYNFIISN